MNIKGKFVTLRAMTRNDMPMIVDLFNDPEIENLVVGWAFPLSLDQQNRWFDNHLGDQQSFRFVIETKDDGAVGIATLAGIDWKNRRADHGIKLLDKAQGKGIGTDALMALMRYVFDELQFNRLDGSWFSDNIASKTMYMKCAWKEEGIRREYIFKRGKWRDLVLTGVLKSDYLALLRNNHYWE